MLEDFTMVKDVLLSTGDSERIWKKYCGFLELSIEDFMTIQTMLLKEQIQLLFDSVLGHKLMGGRKPASIEEFRSNVPLTTYQDYAPYFNEKNEDVLHNKPVIWAHTTTGGAGVFIRAPYSAEVLETIADNIIAAIIISSATYRGEVHAHDWIKVVLNLPPGPYISNIMSYAASKRFDYEAIPPLAESEDMHFEEKIKEGFRIALGSGIDYVCSLAAILVKVGESFGSMGGGKHFSLPSRHPAAILRLLKAFLWSKLNRRDILPRDLWRVKGLVCGGADTAIYRDSITYYWGVRPLDIYAKTESCFIAMEGWNKKGMTFIPNNNFYEFIPEEEWLKSKADSGYKPTTVLLDEVREGEVYELVITNINGGPFMRYRIGDLIKIVALKDEETGVNLPQMVYQSRADSMIDIAGFIRLNEKAITEIIQSIGIPLTDWTARKEARDNRPALNIYLELADGSNLTQNEVKQMIDQKFSEIDGNYRDFKEMTGADPLVITLLKSGTFQEYNEKRITRGHTYDYYKLPHMNAPDEIISDLLSFSQDG